MCRSYLNLRNLNKKHFLHFFSSFPLFLFEVYTKLRIFANEFQNLNGIISSNNDRHQRNNKELRLAAGA